MIYESNTEFRIQNTVCFRPLFIFHLPILLPILASDWRRQELFSPIFGFFDPLTWYLIVFKVTHLAWCRSWWIADGTGRRMRWRGWRGPSRGRRLPPSTSSIFDDRRRSSLATPAEPPTSTAVPTILQQIQHNNQTTWESWFYKLFNKHINNE